MKIITLTLVFYILVCFSIKAHETPNPKIEREIENRTLACSGDLFIIDQNYKEEINIFYATIHVDTNSGYVGVDLYNQTFGPISNKADYDWGIVTDIKENYIVFENRDLNHTGIIYRYAGKIKLEKTKSYTDRSRINYLTGFCRKYLKSEKLF